MYKFGKFFISVLKYFLNFVYYIVGINLVEKKFIVYFRLELII